MHRAVQDVPLEKIVSHQVRAALHEEAVTELMSSIQRHGVLSPLLSYWAGGAYHLVDGHHRLEACRRLGHSTVPMVVDSREVDPTDALGRAVTANTLRTNLDALERAAALQKLMGSGRSLAEAASLCGIKQPAASKLLALLELPPSIQEHIRAGRLGAGIAYELSKIQDPEEQAKLAAEAVQQHLTRDEVLARTKRRTAAFPGKPKVQRTAIPLAGNREVVLLGPAQPSSMDELIDCLKDVLSKAMKYRNRGLTVATFLQQLEIDRGLDQPSPEAGAPPAEGAA